MPSMRSSMIAFCAADFLSAAGIGSPSATRPRFAVDLTAQSNSKKGANSLHSERWYNTFECQLAYEVMVSLSVNVHGLGGRKATVAIAVG